MPSLRSHSPANPVFINHDIIYPMMDNPARRSAGAVKATRKADPGPRSTNLDTWTLPQLRTLKVGGNGSIADFFTKHGGGALLPPGNSDARGRYTSRQAGMYKEELARRVLADERL